jgi:tetratricopeptide (TPR) repeat protein
MSLFEDRMTIRTKSLRVGLLAVIAATLTACATTPPPKPKLQDFLTQADQASTAGDKEKAISLWKQGAVAFPADKTPWSNIAQARYDAKQYGEAIQAAQEVLIRDPNDTLANSIVAISGLRLSTQALADLSRQNNLSGSIKTQSKELAKLLRDTLGEQVLFKDEVPKVQPVHTGASNPPVQPRPKKLPRTGKAGAAAADKDDSSEDLLRVLNNK